VLNINLAQLLRRRSAGVQQQAGTLTHAARTHIAEAVSMYQAAVGACMCETCTCLCAGGWVGGWWVGEWVGGWVGGWVGDGKDTMFWDAVFREGCRLVDK